MNADSNFTLIFVNHLVFEVFFALACCCLAALFGRDKAAGTSALVLYEQCGKAIAYRPLD
ncbi:MAG: hypothetical protein EBQ71_13245 [Betaproteobacteria bacterium]|nr:hypothetical protein [Betaproteobacteria bacterium]